MAFAATTEWDVRTTGNDANGGGFDTASAGVDGSQGAVVFAYSDLVISGATNHLSSVARPFIANDVGNIVNITAGTNFTIGRYQILSVLTGVATMDRVVGTLAASGGSGNLGGSLLTVSKVTTGVTPLFVGGNILHIKSGTYTQTITWPIDTSSASGNLMIVGYNTTHNDGGTKPLITTATNTTKLIQVGTAGKFTFKNISLSNTAGVRADGIWVTSTNQAGVVVISCIFDGFVVALNGDNGAGGAFSVTCFSTEIKNCTSDAIRAFFACGVFGCYIHDNTGNALVQENGSNSSTTADRCIITGNAKGILTVGGASSIFPTTVTNCVIANNTGDGIDGQSLTQLRVTNCIIYANGGFGLHVTSTATIFNPILYAYNAFGGPNVSGNYSSTLPAGIGDITLTANPFTNSAAGDYSLNSTSGGGAACKALGYPGIFPGGLSTGNLDVGAVQSAGGGGGGGISIGVPD